jgi:NAD(P)-dependent dehydrogenase (short-subunit alcohol dehydrogenase family)
MLENKSYVIIGGSGRIGSQLARQLVMLGANVLLAGKTESKLNELAAELKMPYQVMDAISLQDVGDLMDFVIKQWGMLSGAVNCVGSILLKPAHLISGDKSDAVAMA